MKTINQVARETGFTPQYIRTLIRRGTLKSKKIPISEHSPVVRHMIYDESLAEFLHTTQRKTKRTDGRNKFVFYADQIEYASVVDALTAAGLTAIVESLRTANKIKPPYKGGEDEV